MGKKSMKRKKSGKNTWADHYTHQAKKENYAARSVFKLKEIQEKYQVIGKGVRVLDLGCSPGSWMQLASELVGTKGFVAGIDLKPVTVTLPEQARAVVGDIFDITPEMRAVIGEKFDVIISDMAPSTTGFADADAVRSAALCESALYLAEELLVPGGAFVCKIFQGRDFHPFVKKVQATFARQRTFKPKSCRKQSRETYVIGLERRPVDIDA